MVAGWQAPQSLPLEAVQQWRQSACGVGRLLPQRCRDGRRTARAGQRTASPRARVRRSVSYWLRAVAAVRRIVLAAAVTAVITDSSASGVAGSRMSLTRVTNRPTNTPSTMIVRLKPDGS